MFRSLTAALRRHPYSEIVFPLSACLLLGLSSAHSLAQSLTVAVGTPALTLHPGDTNVALPVTVGGDGTYTGPVTVTLTGLPSGITVAPLVVSSSGAGTLQLSASVAADQEAFPADSPADADSATSNVTVMAFAGTLQATANLTLTVSLENPSFAPAPNQINLPIVSIDTGGTPIVSTSTDVPGTITITSPDGQTSILPGAAGTDNTATFHVHGNTTSVMPKKPYHVKLNTGSDLLSAMGLQCPYVTGSGKPVCDKSKSFVLLANYDDKSLLRDWAASALANAIPIGGAYLNEASDAPSPSGTSTLMPWAPHSLFVELYLNGQYEGSYQLIEEVKADSHRVNMTEMAETDVSGTALTGGYLMEIDQRQAEDFVFITPEGVYVGLLDPDNTPEVPEQTSYINSYVDTAEAALFSPDYTDPSLGWRAYFDQASAVNYYVVNDLLGNWDAGRFYSSIYLYKDRNNPLIYMGPVWDFDVSAGNVAGQIIMDPTIPWMAIENPWYAQWFSDPGFKAAVTQQWNALKNNGVLSSWLASISQQAATLQQTQQNNFGRWPMQGIRVWPNAEAVGNYDGEVNYLLDWITLRMGYMDSFLNGLPTPAMTLSLPPGTLRNGSPVTLTSQVTGNHPSGTVTFSYDSIVLGQAPLDSTGTATLTTSSIPPGNWFLEAYYNGDAQNGISGTMAPEVTVLPPLVETVANLTSSTTASAYNASVTLTAAVQAVSGSVAPSGTVTFTSNGAALGSVPVAPNGIASFTTTALPIGADVVQAAYTGDLTYAASAANNVSVNVSQAPATVSLGNTSATYDGNPHSVTVSTTPSALQVQTTYNGSATPPTQAGSYAVVATITDPDYTGTASGTLVISPAPASLSLGNTSATYDGNPHGVTVSTTPAGVQVQTTYNGSATVPTQAGSYAVVATITDPDYTGTASGTLVISPASASLSLGNTAATYDGSPHGATVSTTPSGLGVQVTYNGSATVPTQVGSYAIVATITDPDYTGTASGTLVISPASASLSLGNTSVTYDGNPHGVTVSTTPAGLPVQTTYNGSATPPTQAGSYAVVATIQDSDYAGSVSGNLVIARAAATLTWPTPAAITYGVPLSSAQLDATADQPGSMTYSPAAGAVVQAGTQTLSATWTPTDTVNYAPAVKTVPIVVNKQATSVNLTASSTAAAPNQAVIFSASVVATGAPSGTVSFFDGANLLASVPVSNGAASYTTAALPSGANTITATYSGDPNFLGSQSASAISLNVAPLDFVFTASGASSQTVPNSGSAAFSFTLTPTNSIYPGPVSFTVSGAPAGSSYALSQSGVDANAGPQQIGLTIASPSQPLTESARLNFRNTVWAWALFLLPLAGSRRRRQARKLWLVLLMLGGVGIMGLTGCGSSPAPVQTYNITVTASSGALQHSAVVTLTLQ